jgi:DNA processing protein
MSNTATEKINWLRLARSQNVGKSTFFRLLEIFSSVERALQNISEMSRQGGANQKIKVCSQSEAEKEFEDSLKFNAEIILFKNSDYPKLLKEIADPPPIITIKGKKELLEKDKIAVVGPRNASFNGIAFAKKIAQDLGQHNFVVTSGLARGVDAAAHQSSLSTGTIAVIAGGINDIYPKENSELYQKITDSGLLISEQPFGSPPKGGNFIQRNRIISGLSLGVVVVEASIKSGTLVTARFAGEQGREVFAVPGSPFDSRCHGTNRLIKDGARLTEGIEDILAEIQHMKNLFRDDLLLRETQEDEFVDFAVKIPSESKIYENEIAKIREEIFSHLSYSPISIEDISQNIESTPRIINIALVQLELADKIEINFGKVSLKKN